MILLRIIVFGVGKFYSSRKDEFMKLSNDDVLVAYLDNKFVGDKTIDNVPAINPARIDTIQFDCIIIMSVYVDEIYTQLHGLGINDNKICTWQKYVSHKIRLKNAPYEQNNNSSPKVLSACLLLDKIVKEEKSLVRFGDGEFELMRMRKRPWFQEVNANLSSRLKEVMNSEVESVLIAIADDFGNLDKYTEEAADAIRHYMTQDQTRNDLLKMLFKDRAYYDAYVTRPYLMYRDKHYAEKIFSLWKKVWQNRNILLVEGKTSRMGRNNDLLSKANSIRRILCPDSNAFNKYDEILLKILEYTRKNDLILIKLGPTATVLGYDLAQKGFQAIDIGQLDNEYDWYKMGVQQRVEIKGKMVAEILDGRSPCKLFDPLFEKEILCYID